MSEFVAGVSAFTALGTLAFSGIVHLADQDGFREDLLRQQIFPAPTTTWIAIFTTGAELLVGFGGLLSVTFVINLRVTALYAAGLLLGSFAAYSWLLIRRTPGAPCGCGSHHEATSSAVTLRALALSAMAWMGALLIHADPTLDFQLSGAPLTVVLLAAIAFGSALWILPEATSESPTKGKPVQGVT